MGYPVKNQLKNGLEKLFNLLGHKIDVSDHDVFVLKYAGLNEEEVRKTTVVESITAI